MSSWDTYISSLHFQITDMLLWTRTKASEYKSKVLIYQCLLSVEREKIFNDKHQANLSPWNFSWHSTREQIHVNIAVSAAKSSIRSDDLSQSSGSGKFTLKIRWLNCYWRVNNSWTSREKQRRGWNKYSQNNILMCQLFLNAVSSKYFQYF